MPHHPLIDKEAPSFSVPDANGQIFKFPPEEGGERVEKPIALFFYPASGTYGCTREACQFRDALAEKEIFKRSDVLVIGISSDPVDKQKAFVDKHKLSYPVLSDTEQVAHKAYQVGKGMLGLTDARTTFVIDRKGVIKGVLSATMNFNAHVKFVTKELEKMHNPDATETGSDVEPYVEPLEAAEREELARAAAVVSA